MSILGHVLVYGLATGVTCSLTIALAQQIGLYPIGPAVENQWADVVGPLLFVPILTSVTSWIGIGAAASRNGLSTISETAILGVIFAIITIAMFLFLDGGTLHNVGIAIVLIWFTLGAPIFAFIGMAFNRSLGSP